jgi:NAD(P)H-hydrate epimerase
VLLLGPGWAEEDRGPGRELLETVLDSGLACVIDAGALRILASLDPDRIARRPGGAALILTPHPGEFHAISGIPSDRALANPSEHVRALAAKLNAVVILKSSLSWIASPKGYAAVYEGREPSLATAGSGDVLAGLIAGLWAGTLGSPKVGSSPRTACPGDSPAVHAGKPGDVPATLASDFPVSDCAFMAACAGMLLHGAAGKVARAKHGFYDATALPEEAGRLLEACQRS